MGSKVPRDWSALAAASGAALTLAALWLPWAGYQGLRTVGPGVGLVAAAVLAAAAARADRRLSWLALGTGAAAAALVAWRLVVEPADPALQALRSPAALALALAGAVAVVAGSAILLRAPSERRSGVLDRAALAEVAHALWVSRALVWAAGVLAVLKLGIEPSITPPGLSRPFGGLGNLLMAPATAWDANFYVAIAQYGYGAGPELPAFFPLYPVLVRGFAATPQTTVVAAVVVSLAALAVALYLLHRLVTFERGRDTADLTVLLVAFSPMAVFFSAAYTESVFLALTVGAFYAGRRGWWARAGMAGALAAATRPNGVLILLALLVLYASGHGRRPVVRRDAAWLALVPLGALAYVAYSASHGDALAPFEAQETYWDRSLMPLAGAVQGVADGWASLRQLGAEAGAQVLATPTFVEAGQLSDPLKLAGANLTDLAFLAFGCVATIGALRRLPAAYGVYALATLLLAVSARPDHEPLQSLPRFLLVAFPCQVWLALWASTPQRRRAVLLVSAGLMAFFAAQYASWRWVA